MRGPRVEQGRQEAPDDEGRVEDALDVGHRVEQLADTAVTEHLALHRHEDLVGGRQRVQRQHPQRRRAVEQHHVVVTRHGLQGRPQHELASGAGEQLRLRPGQVDGRRHQVDALGRRQQHVGDRRRPGEHLVQTPLDRVGVDAERERQASLRVEVDEQHAEPVLGRGRPEAGDGGRLGDAALLVRHRHHAGSGVHGAYSAPRGW